MDSVFGTEGILAAHLPHYEPRTGQKEMADLVARLLQSSPISYEFDPFAGLDDLDNLDDLDIDQAPQAECLMIEAETGLGKTLAYLVPAILSGRKVVVSTNTRNLQDQILESEIPFIRTYIVPKLTAMSVKGRQNYLCLYRWHQLTSGGQQQLFADNQFAAIDTWLGETRFADRAEMEGLHGNSPLWQKICCISHFCLGSDCPDSGSCFLNRLRREAAACQLLVVNHHLLFSDLSVRSNGYGEVLPRYESVIFDEAHHLERVATNFFGFSFSRYQMLDLISDIEQSMQESSRTGSSREQEVVGAARSLAGLNEQFAAAFPVEKGRFPLAGVFESQAGLEQIKETVLAALNTLANKLDKIKGTNKPWEQYMNRCLDLSERLQAITTPTTPTTPVAESEEEQPRYIHWFERTDKNLTLSATPIDVAKDLQNTLFNSVSHCVFTSATLRTGSSFSYFSKGLGIPEQSKSCSFPSPFDYAANSLLYIPNSSFPEPAASGYRASLHDAIHTLVSMSRGRALLLFTSFHAMDTAWYALRDVLDFPLLRQGKASRRELLARFSQETDSVLFAVASFWEGVDVPGESLSMVIIDKLPFEVPSDPVIMARMDRIKAAGNNPFFQFQVPRAILTLRQGVGRLMRRSGDQGVIAVLDVRLFSKGYGGRFLKSLPAAPVSRDIDDVEDFFS